MGQVGNIVGMEAKLEQEYRDEIVRLAHKISVMEIKTQSNIQFAKDIRNMVIDPHSRTIVDDIIKVMEDYKPLT